MTTTDDPCGFCEKPKSSHRGIDLFCQGQFATIYTPRIAFSADDPPEPPDDLKHRIEKLENTVDSIVEILVRAEAKISEMEREEIR